MGEKEDNEIPTIDLSADDYRDKARPPRAKLTFFEAASFSIGSTLATRKRPPPDPAKTARLIQATAMGLTWYFTHHLG